MIYYIPFGRNCQSCEFLNNEGGLGLRKFHLPFDWVLGEPEYIKRSLDTNFEEWFDIQYMNVVPSMDGFATNHSLYPLKNHHQRVHNSGFFEHFDMTKPEFQAKYRRAVTRFNNIINNLNNKIILVTNISYDDLKSNGLIGYFERDNVYLVILKHIVSNKNIIEVEQYDDHKVINQYTLNYRDLWEDIRLHIK